MQPPKTIDFYRLPRPVQDRFAAATRRSAPPAPLLFQRAPRTVAWTYLTASGLLMVVALVLLGVGWGDVHSALALHGPKMLAVDIALFAAASYGLVHATAVLRTQDALPWRAGTYLFPACVVDARSPLLNVWSVGESEGAERVASPAPALALRMRDGSRVVVPAPSVEQAERADAALTSMRPELERAIAQGDPHALAELDPLHDSALSSPIGPKEAMKRAVPVWTRLDWAIAAVAGVALGVALGTTRNAMSDEAMYRSISSTPTIESYRLYLSRGGRHSDEVRDVLLPRAELREAETQGTVEAVRTFAQAHPSTKIGPEVDAVLRRGMLGELEKAKKAGTVGALDEFAKNYPDHNVDAELKSARHALYARALGAWKDKTHAAAPTKAFVERLLAWAEKAGPVCEVRFRLKPSKTLEDADKSIMKNEHYPGADALPSKYMTASAMRPREERVAQSVAQAFASAFPSDMLDVRSGEPLAADAPVPTNMPTLVVEYAPEWAHANTLSMKPPTVFAGISLGFDASFMLPQGDPVKISTKASRGPELWKIKGGGMTREDFEQKVYDTMIDAAFDQLEKKLNDAFF